MNLRLALVPFAFLGLTGCVAAVPMVTQLATNPDAMRHLCAMARVAGQTNNLCDRARFDEPHGTTHYPEAPVNTASR